MKTSRAYEMRARAEQTEQTRRRILDACAELGGEKPIFAIALPDVAERAGVSVQTVLRQFGSRDGLFDATGDYVRAEVVAERKAPPGDIDAIVEILMAHYELRGDSVLLFLGQERWEPRAAQITDAGRRIHRVWVEAVFAPVIPAGADERDEVIDLLIVATDVYTWKLLRRDRGLSIEETSRRIRRMITHTVEGIENVDHPVRHH